VNLKEWALYVNLKENIASFIKGRLMIDYSYLHRVEYINNKLVYKLNKTLDGIPSADLVKMSRALYMLSGRMHRKFKWKRWAYKKRNSYE